MSRLNIIFSTLLIIWILLAVLFAFTDLAISKVIVNESSSWAGFLENYGMIPGVLVILSGVFIYYSSIKQKTGVWSYTCKTIFFLSSTGLILYIILEVLTNTRGNNFAEENLLFFLIVSFAVSIFIFILLHAARPVKSIILITYSKIVVEMAIFGYLIFIQLIKFLWGRVRFRDLESVVSQFTPWYLPQGINGNDSFPSGHAAMGWMLLALFVLVINKNTWARVFVLSFVIAWAILVAVSRVTIGAHYFSDVTFGSFFIISTFLVLYKKTGRL